MGAHSSVESRAAVHSALGDPTRLAVVDALLLGDASPSVLASRLGIASNLMAHHLKVLESTGLVSRVRSEGDRRRSYLRLDAPVLDSLRPVVRLSTPRVVFVCTHNSARSQLAAALWRQHSQVPVASAGTHPARRVHPRAVAAARRHSLSLGRVRPAPLADVLTDSDLVVTVCDGAHEELEHELARRSSPALHWSIPDPAPRDSDGAFEAAYAAVAAHIDRLAPTVEPSPAVIEP
jgi:protein-tyrosine-phosphatase/DNA-binding HxlR family transcriptional regulator